MYGSALGVASYCRSITSSGVFTTSTHPTLSSVQSWLEQISAMLDSILASQGFKTPLENDNAVQAATTVVEQTVADMAKGANSTGRFFTDKALQNGQSMWQTIATDLASWVEIMAPGLEQMGAERASTSANTIGHHDEAYPIFQRDGFGNKFTDWSNG